MVKNSSNHRARPGRGRRAAHGAGTRAAILAAAERCFAERGLAGARTDAIAAAAGVNKAMLYYYFRSKAGLYEAVVDEHFDEFNRQALAVLAQPGSARRVLLQYAALHFDFVSSRHRCGLLYQQLMMTGGRPLERIVRKYFVPRSRALARLLARGTRDGEFRPADRFHTGVSLTALIVFYFSAAQVLRLMGHADAFSPANLKRRKLEVLEFISHGLFLKPAGSA